MSKCSVRAIESNDVLAVIGIINFPNPSEKKWWKLKYNIENFDTRNEYNTVNRKVT